MIGTPYIGCKNIALYGISPNTSPRSVCGWGLAQQTIMYSTEIHCHQYTSAFAHFVDCHEKFGPAKNGPPALYTKVLSGGKVEGWVYGLGFTLIIYPKVLHPDHFLPRTKFFMTGHNIYVLQLFYGIKFIGGIV